MVPPVAPPAAVPPLEAPLELGAELLELATALDELEELAELLAVLVPVVAVVAVVAVVEPGVEVAAMVDVGTVSGGASTVSAAGVPELLPQPAMARLVAKTASEAANLVGPLSM